MAHRLPKLSGHFYRPEYLPFTSRRIGFKDLFIFCAPASRHTNSDEADFNDGLGYGFLTVRWSGALVGLVRFDYVVPAPPPVPG